MAGRVNTVERDEDVFLSSRPAVCLAIGLAGLVSNGILV